MAKDKDTSKIGFVDFNNLDRYKEHLLSMDREMQLDILKLAYRKGIDTWFETQRIFKEAPLDKGGITADTIDQLFQELILNSSDIFGEYINT